MEHATGTLLCSDLFADDDTDHPPIFEGEILGPSDTFRRKLGDFYTRTKETRALLTPARALKPTILARMHGSACRGDCAMLLLALADTLAQEDDSL